MVELLTFTEATDELVNELADIHGDLVFHQSGGCCDGSAPMCFPRNEFKVGSRDIYLGGSRCLFCSRYNSIQRLSYSLRISYFFLICHHVFE
jgi:uncharacterized protein (DUF779 family)